MDTQKLSVVPVQLHGMARQMISGEDLPLFMDVALASEVANHETLFEGSNIPKPLQEFLVELNMKVDTILGAVTKDVAKNDFPIDLRIHMLSGSGLVFTSQEQFKPGTNLEVVITLGQVPMVMVGAMGRIDKLVKMPSGQVGYSLVFTKISTDHQDSLVQFVFQEERRRIREKKEKEYNHPEAR